MSLEAKDLRGNDPEELRRTLRQLEEDLFKHKLKKNTSQLENTMQIRSTRRDIARVQTVLAERLRGSAGETNSGETKSTTKAATESAAKSAAKSDATKES